MTAEKLKTYTARDLAQMAKKKGVSGWHAMTKAELVQALVKANRAKAATSKNTRATATSRASKTTARSTKKQSTASTRSSSGKSKPTSRSAVATRSTGTARSGSGRSGASARSTAAKSQVTKSSAIKSQAKSSESRNGQQPTAATAKQTAKQTAATNKSVNGKVASNKAASNGRATKSVAKPVAPPKTDPRVARQLAKIRHSQDQAKNLAFNNGDQDGQMRDRLVAMVRDPFWLHAFWELSRASVQRAEAALAQDWHSARPVLRVFEVASNSETSSTETLLRDISIHGGVNNWYIDVPDPPKSFRLDIGYLAANGRYFSLARSNVVTTPKAGASDSLDENWSDVAENFEKIYAMSGGTAESQANSELQELFEERLRRPMGSPMLTRFGGGLDSLGKRRQDFSFNLDAELIVYGSTEPGAHVTLQGDPVKLRPDGTFTVRFSLPNCRQVIPAVASSADGVEQRTIVLAVERNTKVMEPLIRDADD